MAAARDAQEQQLKPTTQSVCFLACLDLTGLALQPGNACIMVAGVAKNSLVRVKYEIYGFSLWQIKNALSIYQI